MSKNIPTRDDDGLDDFDDDDDWAAAKPVNLAQRQQQVNAARPQTSGKPGMRGFHGIGKKPQMAATGADNDLDDMLDGFSGGPDPLAAIN